MPIVDGVEVFPDPQGNQIDIVQQKHIRSINGWDGTTSKDGRYGLFAPSTGGMEMIDLRSRVENSHWSRSLEILRSDWLILRQLSSTIKSQLKTKCPLLGAFLAFRCFFMA